MGKPRILIQLDPDKHASSFDAVVAIDSEVDHLLQYQGVAPDEVEALVHGAIFTRGPADLKNTAIFVGGTDVQAGETLLARVQKTFFGPMRVSVMLDANGANTTAAAAVLAAARHLPLSGVTATVLAGTGPVGQRAARLLAARGAAEIRVGSRSEGRAAEACAAIATHTSDNAPLKPVATGDDAQLKKSLDGAELVIAAGAAGIQLLSREVRSQCSQLKVAIDLNAVPPLGIEDVGVMDRAVEQDGQIVYGAIGVGGTKMKIHKAAIQQLFSANDQVLDAESIYALGEQLP